MAIIGAFDIDKGFSEYTYARNTSSGWKTPTQLKATALTNLGAASALGVTNGTATASRALVTDANNGIGGFRNTTSTRVFYQTAPQTVNATATMTAANILGGIITSTTAAAVAATLPLATALETALLLLHPGLQVDDAFEIVVINTGGTNAFTMTTNTGWTLVGTMAVAANTSARFWARRTAANTYTLYKV